MQIGISLEIKIWYYSSEVVFSLALQGERGGVGPNGTQGIPGIEVGTKSATFNSFSFI